ncbi:MAG: DUF134 domain-containing protein [Firmicutes bacterium]|nr:DUF134 domain-containing protein [Bacillota bacterium]
MVRPRKLRKVGFIPQIQYFVPFGIDPAERQENILRIEELEALRLKDLEGLEQESCAEQMEISRQTFQRILSEAREKVADSLIHGKALRIEGGNYTRNICPVQCLDCGKEWRESYENFEKIINGEFNCPTCNSNRIICARQEKKKFCWRHCRRHGGES